RHRTVVGGESLPSGPAAERYLLHRLFAVSPRRQRRDRRQSRRRGAVDSGDVVPRANCCASRSHHRNPRGSVKRALVLVAVSALLVSCEPIVHHILTLTFDDSAQHVTISASTKIGAAKP